MNINYDKTGQSLRKKKRKLLLRKLLQS